MALFESRRVRELEEENHELELQITDLKIQISNLKHQRFMRAYELEEELIGKLDLSNTQLSKLRFVFSIERARAAGVPEEQILHDREEIEKFFTSKES